MSRVPGDVGCLYFFRVILRSQTSPAADPTSRIVYFYTSVNRTCVWNLSCSFDQNVRLNASRAFPLYRDSIFASRNTVYTRDLSSTRRGETWLEGQNESSDGEGESIFLWSKCKRCRVPTKAVWNILFKREKSGKGSRSGRAKRKTKIMEKKWIIKGPRETNTRTRHALHTYWKRV